jgi:hypothetical protein
MGLPKLFIGSSVEGLDVAYAIQENLEYDAETTVWRQGLFAPSGQALRDLMVASEKFEYAVFAFTADDVVRIRGQSFAAVRDNLIFELGLFFGVLGLSRCFYVVAREASSLRLPTDLLGVAPLTFQSSRSDGNLIASLGAACNQIRRAFREPSRDRRSLDGYIAAWNASPLLDARASVRSFVPDHYSEEWARTRRDFERLFAFLESLSDAVLSGSVDEHLAKRTFEESILSFWPHAAVMLAPPSQADEWWDPLPKLGELYGRWSSSDATVDRRRDGL